eukprot:10393409-Alexandrium_andersonii.AAC.1
MYGCAVCECTLDPCAVEVPRSAHHRTPAHVRRSFCSGSDANTSPTDMMIVMSSPARGRRGRDSGFWLQS